MAPGIWVPATQLGQEQWFLLSHFGDRHLIRCVSVKSTRDVKDPSDHRLREILVETSVKWRPRDPAKIVIRDLPPLGPKR